MRLIQTVRAPIDGDLLVQLMDDAPLTPENVTKLLQFARSRLDATIGGVMPQIEEVCSEYLRANNAPIPPRPPRAGESGFHSVLEELGE